LRDPRFQTIELRFFPTYDCDKSGYFVSNSEDGKTTEGYKKGFIFPVVTFKGSDLVVLKGQQFI
jgi:hypothetical protein